jgi:hypothetical protein
MVKEKISMKARYEIGKKEAKSYFLLSKKEKGLRLREISNMTGWNRDYTRQALKAILLRKQGRYKYIRKSRSKKYDNEFIKLLGHIWVLSGCMCGKYLHIQMKEFLDNFIKNDELKQFNIDKMVKEKLIQISGSSIDRCLKPIKKKFYLKYKYKHNKPNNTLKKSIPLDDFNATFPNTPGKFETDTVFHCDRDNSGHFARTLNLTDIFSGWTEMICLLNDATTWIKDGLKNILENKIPFPVNQIDIDNGPEFINYTVINWLYENNYKVTRSRSYRKNDNAHIEQKNGAVIRKYAFHYRYDTIREVNAINELYKYLRFQVNYFMPTKKVIDHIDIPGKRPKPIYDEKILTPYQRLLSCDKLDPDYKNKLTDEYNHLNLAEINKNILKCQNKLIALVQQRNLRQNQDKKQYNNGEIIQY